tara:strand:+ start:304 stop:1002 length:699 start_codon:yes stop_codon:yes gene_type:complete
MKKLLSLLFISVCLLSVVNAQSTFTIHLNDSIVQDVVFDDYTEMKIEQENLSNDTLILGVEILYNTIPLNWDGMVCIYGTCFGTIPPAGATNQMDPVYGSTKGYVRLTVNPYGDLQNGVLRVLVFDINNPTVTDTCTWVVNSINPLTSENDKQIDVLSIFPIPASDFVTISSSDLFKKVVITDLQGKKIMENTVIETTETVINISKLTSGVYFSKIYTDEKLLSCQKFIVSE